MTGESHSYLDLGLRQVSKLMLHSMLTCRFPLPWRTLASPDCLWEGS